MVGIEAPWYSSDRGKARASSQVYRRVQSTRHRTIVGSFQFLGSYHFSCQTLFFDFQLLGHFFNILKKIEKTVETKQTKKIPTYLPETNFRVLHMVLMYVLQMLV